MTIMGNREFVPIDLEAYADVLVPGTRETFSRLMANIGENKWTVIVGPYKSGKTSMLWGVDKQLRTEGIRGKIYFDVSDCPSPDRLENTMASSMSARTLDLNVLPKVILLDEFTNVNNSTNDMGLTVDFFNRCREMGKIIVISCLHEPINPRLVDFFSEKITLTEIPENLRPAIRPRVRK
jgi:predicted AAA+ superfamily ATPase